MGVKRTFPDSVFEDIRKIYPCFNIEVSSEKMIELLKGNKNVKERNLDIFIKYYNGKTLDELSKEYGITRERIRQICRVLLRIVRRLLMEDGIKAFEERGMIAVLSTRSYNAIARYLYKTEDFKCFAYYNLRGTLIMDRLTAGKVLELYNSGKLSQIRNLGSKSIQEIASVLSKLGYKVNKKLYSN